jgi:hypothetical protein
MPYIENLGPWPDLRVGYIGTNDHGILAQNYPRVKTFQTRPHMFNNLKKMKTSQGQIPGHLGHGSKNRTILRDNLYSDFLISNTPYKF